MKKQNYRPKMGDEELQQYLLFKRRGCVVPAKKGKGSFKRKEKHRKEWQKNDYPQNMD